MAQKQDIARTLAMLLLAVVVGTVLAVLLSRGGVVGSPGQSLPAHYLINEPAPDFTLPLVGGGAVKLSELKGKVVVLDFWATWCPPCVATLPSTAEIAKQYADRGVVIHTINVSDSPEKIQSFLAEHKLDLSVALAAESDVGTRYGVQYIPQLFVIDARGVVIGASSDPSKMHDWLVQSIESALKAGQAS